MLPEFAVALDLKTRFDWWAWYDRWFNHSFRQSMYGEGEPIEPPRWLLEVLAQVWVEASGTLEGMWDAVGAHQARGIEFVEAKRCQGIGGSR